MLEALRVKSAKWKESNYANYAVESLTEVEKGYIRHPQNQQTIDDPTLSLFIIRAALHYGGNWYYWLFSTNRSSAEVIKLLIESLDISYQRVKYRVLFALQFFPENDVMQILNNNFSLSSNIRTQISSYVLSKNVWILFDEIKAKDETQKGKIESVQMEIEQYWPTSKLSLVNMVDKCYKIFISFSKFDIKIAEIIASSINNYFKGAVEVFFAPKDIKIGSKWKEIILNALNKYDAIISLISQDTYEKPWIIAEFSAFWLQSKDVYILKYGDIDYTKIFNIFADYQICDIQNESDIIDLIEVISSKAKVKFAPFDKVREMLNKINISVGETLSNKPFYIKIDTKNYEINTKEINAIVDSIPNISNSRKLSKIEIKELARKVGLLTKWKINPHLTFTNGDISWYFEQNYTQLKIESEFKAKYNILSIAENERQFIPDQGSLSAISQGIAGEVERIWRERH